MSNSANVARQAHLGMVLWALIVGLSFPVVELMTEGLPPILLTALRFVVAVLALWPLVRREADRWPNLRGLVLYALMGLCQAGFFGTMFWAAHRISALSMAALYVSVPLLAYAMGRGLAVEPRAGRLLAILALGAAGALGLALAQAENDSTALRLGIGEVVFFFGCLSTALYPVLSKWGLVRGMLSPNAALRTFWSLLAGGVVIVLMGLLLEAPRTLVRMTWSDILLVVYLGLFSSGLTFWLMQRGTAALTPGAVTAYTYLVPFVSVVLLFVNQPQVIGWQWLPGGFLVLLAISLLLYRDARNADHRSRPGHHSARAPGQSVGSCASKSDLP